MSEVTPISVPRENVNDESVKLLSWLIADNAPVKTGQPIAEIETSKATADVISPTDGFLTQAAKVGSEVAVGGVLGYVRATADAKITPAAAPAPTPAPHEVAFAIAGPKIEAPPLPLPDAPALNGSHPENHKPGTRISLKAMALIKERGLDPALFTGKGLVSTNDVLIHLGQAPAKAPTSTLPASAPTSTSAASPTCPAPTPATGVPVRTEALSRAKKIEGRYLSSGLRSTLPSVITVAAPTRGLRAAAAAHALLQGQATALIIHETARLLRKYPVFNAYHADGSVNYYEQVNIGFAVDADLGLKVPVIRDADTKSIAQIAEEMLKLVIRYLDNSLPVETLAGGTFTLTDLSGEGVFAFHPLINQGQSAILGISGEFFAPGSPEGFFNMALAFDHHVSEGRKAAQFLNDLKLRLASYEKSLGAGAADAPAPAYCSRCHAPAEELERMEHYLLKTQHSNGQGVLICSRCLLGHT